MARGAEAFRPFYDLARASWPIFPDPVILSVSDPNGAESKGIDSNGRPVFWIDPAYEITDIIAYHECGHAFEALLERHGLSKDYTRTRLWQFRQWSGTWQQQLATAEAMTGKERWNNEPVEIVAECWRCGHMGPPAERTVYLSEIDYAAQRAFYESLQQEAGVAQVDYPGAIWIASPNYTVGRAAAISAIVEHWTVASASSAINTFKSSASRVSPHYLVARDGSVYQFVREGNAAWHDSSTGWNDKSIGIEHEHEIGQDWPTVQLEASAALHRSIRARRGAIASIGHGSTYPVFTTECPGDLPIAVINEEDDMFTDADRAKLNRVYDHLEAYEGMVWTQRLQNWLSKAFKSIPSYAAPTDYTGPDVTTGQPRT